MSEIRFTDNLENSKKDYSNWTESEKFNSFGKKIARDGHTYLLIDKKEYRFSKLERLKRGCIGISLIIRSFGTSLLDKQTLNYFTKQKKTVHFAVLLKKSGLEDIKKNPDNIKNSEAVAKKIIKFNTLNLLNHFSKDIAENKTYSIANKLIKSTEDPIEKAIIIREAVKILLKHEKLDQVYDLCDEMPKNEENKEIPVIKNQILKHIASFFIEKGMTDEAIILVTEKISESDLKDYLICEKLIPKLLEQEKTDESFNLIQYISSENTRTKANEKYMDYLAESN